MNRSEGGIWANSKPGVFSVRAFCVAWRSMASYAFVGLSKPRYKRFEGLPLDEKLKAADSEPWCGVQVIDLEGKNSCVDWFRIDGAVAEIFDVAVLPGVGCPMSLGFASNEIRTAHHL